VEKNMEIIHRNPILCLKLKKGFTKKVSSLPSPPHYFPPSPNIFQDVKKAYKQQALKYHPGPLPPFPPLPML
jgi:hypothetical protein